MKKLILAATAISIFATASFASNNNDKEKDELKAKSIKECAEQLSQAGYEIDKAAAFCECYTDKLFEEYTVEQIKDMEKYADGNTEMPEAIQAKIQEIFMGCATELQ